MAFVVETGVGLSNANAYISVEFADTYHSERGHSAWVGDAATKQIAIIRATDFIDKRFGRRFRGTRMQKEQALEWPRLAAYDDDQFTFTGIDVIPRKLQQACAEYALRALSSVLIPDPTSTPVGSITGKREKVGPIEEETRYSFTTSRASVSELVSTTNIPEFPEADLLLQELLKSSNIKRLVRG